VVGIRPDREPDDDLQPGPLPLITEFTMSLFTLLYVGPILTIMYYLFCWGKSTAAGRTIMQQRAAKNLQQMTSSTTTTV